MPLVTLPNGLRVWVVNRADAAGLYNDIYVRQSYVRHGLSVEDGATIFDVGANVGLFSISLAQARRDLSIYAFEPIPQIYALLERNADLHLRSARVHLRNLGLSSAPGVATFQFSPAASSLATMRGDDMRRAVRPGATTIQWIRAWLEAYEVLNPRSRLIRTLLAGLDRPLPRAVIVSVFVAARWLAARNPRRPRTADCRLSTLSQIIDEEQVQTIDLLKIDVEGSEMDVLNGIRPNHWGRIRQLALEVHDVDGRARGVQDLLRTQGFTVDVEASDLSLHRLSGIYMLHASRPR